MLRPIAIVIRTNVRDPKPPYPVGYKPTGPLPEIIPCKSIRECHRKLREMGVGGIQNVTYKQILDATKDTRFFYLTKTFQKAGPGKENVRWGRGQLRNIG